VVDDTVAGLESSLVTVTFDVTAPQAPVNPVPTAVDDFFTTTEGNNVGGYLTNNDIVANGVLSTQAAGPTAAHGTVTIGIDGWMSYTPDAGFVGTDTFGYQALSTLVTPWTPSNIAIVTVEVTAPVTLEEQLPTEGEDVPTDGTTPAASTPAALAQTGSDGAWFVLLSFLLVYAGGMALRFSRKAAVADGSDN
jgi:hypothetical protein